MAITKINGYQILDGSITLSKLANQILSADHASALTTTGAAVVVALSAPPSAGKILTATSATNAAWLTPAPPPTVNVAVSAATSQAVSHSRGYYPIVQVLDATGAMVLPDSVTHTDANHFTVTFSPAFTGTIVYR